MAPKPTEQEQRLDNDTDAKDLLHDFVYREDMDVSEVSQYLETDWDDAYDWLKDQLKAAKDDE